MSVERMKIVITDDMRLREKTTRALAAVVKANSPDPSVFVYGSSLVRLIHLESEGTLRTVLERLNSPQLKHRLERVADWYREIDTEKGPIERVIEPPPSVVQDLLSSPTWPLPPIERIVTAPIFGPDGTLHWVPGYHRESRTFYAPARGFTLPEVPKRPTKADVIKAKNTLFVELLSDFPFAGQADRAHVIAGMLTPSTRSMVRGSTPLMAINAPVKGTGKTLLARAMVYPTTGDAAAINPEARGEEEWRKRIGAWLADGPQVVWIDNLKSKLWSGSFAAALTEDLWTDRLLGRNDVTIRYPIRPLWVITGNNLNLSDEIARRSVPIRLDAGTENPHLRDRKTFRHPDLIGWMRTNRGDLVWAVLVLVRAWQQAGSPAADMSLGSYDAWAGTIGGILEVAEIEGFLGNLNEFYEQFDPETRGWKAFVLAWWQQYANQTVRPSELLVVYDSLDDDFVNVGAWTDRSRSTTLGKRLLQQQGRIFDGYQIALTDNAQGGNRWRLIQAGGE